MSQLPAPQPDHTPARRSRDLDRPTDADEGTLDSSTDTESGEGSAVAGLIGATGVLLTPAGVFLALWSGAPAALAVPVLLTGIACLFGALLAVAVAADRRR
jgi:hypothetical protein